MPIADTAARLRGDLNLKTPDAIQAASTGPYDHDPRGAALITRQDAIRKRSCGISSPAQLYLRRSADSPRY